MNIKEHDNNIITKERTDIEKYLLRIIQRYFDIENNYTKESIEEMVLESLTRFKQFISIEKGFIFSLNQKTGHLILSIRDFGGQPRFNKKTAFNKNFGIIDNTICEGDDPRLSDIRSPLYHNHVIGDINGLLEILTPIESSKEMHIHENEETINILRYTGEKTEIDLIMLEYLKDSINKYYENLEYSQRETGAILRSGLETISNLLIEAQNYLKIVQDMVDNDIRWIKESKEYTDLEIKTQKDKFIQETLRTLSQEDINKLSNNLKKSYHVIADGEIPLSDGTFTCVPVVDSVIIEAGSEEGDALKLIFDEGTEIGKSTTDPTKSFWTWDDVNKSFVYTDNEQNNHTMFIGLSKFETYTHRVTFSSTDGDDDTISTIIAYDEETGNHLSLFVALGGVRADTNSNSIAAVLLNYTGGYSPNTFFGVGRPVTQPGIIPYKEIGPGNIWSALTNGVTVLVKRTKNNVKVWVNYNTPNTWQPETINGVKDIYPTTLPDFEFNFEDYPELASFVNKKMKYGYGCFSQAMSTYRDVYVIGESFSTTVGSAGHVNVMESKELSYNVPSTIINTVDNSKVKMFLKHNLSDGTVITTPLPYSFQDNNKTNVVIQGFYSSNGKINIQSNFIDKVPDFYATNLAVYQNQYVIGCCKYTPETIRSLKNLNIDLIKIESDDKNNFVKALIPDDNLYRIQGRSMRCYTGNLTEERYRFDDLTFMNYFHWDLALKNVKQMCISINKDGNWVSTPIVPNGYYVLEYPVKKLSDFFINPRVYYQVLGNEEI